MSTAPGVILWLESGDKLGSTGYNACAMRFSKLAEYLQELEKTSSRNQITEILSRVFGEASESEIDKICYLSLGRIEPQYTGVEFNFAERMMIRAMSTAYTVDGVQILAEYKKKGDLGDVAYVVASNRRHVAGDKLFVEDVYKKLHQMAVEGGKDSQERKLEAMADLLKEVDPLSAKYIVRIPVGKLRLGFSDATILDALSLMKVGDKSARKIIEGAYNVLSDIGKIARHVKSGKLESLKRIYAVPGIPVRTSLSERLPTAEKIIEKVGPKVAVEPKYDGFRTQVHVWGAGKVREVRLFSRNHENVTPMFPEIIEAAKKLPIEDGIFDGEAIGFDPETKRFVLFQQTVQRKRKHDVESKSQQIPLKVFVFDVLYLNGEDVIARPFSERRKLLEEVLGKSVGTIMLTRQLVIEKSGELKSAFDEYIKEGLEGVMAKKLDAPYAAGGRGFHWVKYKKHTEGEVFDTIDCVLMGAYRGRGKRAGFGVGGFLLGVPGKDGKYYSISNLGTGLSDAQFRTMNKVVEKLKTENKPEEYFVGGTRTPDVWVSPKVVLEVLADEITSSPRHTSKYSLRFPRLIKVREDKNPDQATTVHEVETLYGMQAK